MIRSQKTVNIWVCCHSDSFHIISISGRRRITPHQWRQQCYCTVGNINIYKYTYCSSVNKPETQHQSIQNNLVSAGESSIQPATKSSSWGVLEPIPLFLRREYTLNEPTHHSVWCRPLHFTTTGGNCVLLSHHGCVNILYAVVGGTSDAS